MRSQLRLLLLAWALLPRSLRPGVGFAKRTSNETTTNNEY